MGGILENEGKGVSPKEKKEDSDRMSGVAKFMEERQKDVNIANLLKRGKNRHFENAFRGTKSNIYEKGNS